MVGFVVAMAILLMETSVLGLSVGTPMSSKSNASTGPDSENFTPTGDGLPLRSRRP
jgi:hypothetical protein